MAVRRTNSGRSSEHGHGCPFCGNGTSRSGGGLWKWVVGGVIAWAVLHGASSGDSGSSDYKPPAHTQTEQKKCDPGALIQFGCTP